MENEKKDVLSAYSNFLDSRKQHLTFAAISTYLNAANELSDKERNFLNGHLNSCTTCSARLKEVEAVENAGEEARLEWWNSPAAFRYAMAATLVVALGASLVLYMTLNRSGEKGIDSSPGQPLAANAADPRFVSNEMLENFIARTVRSASGTKLLTPSVGDTLATPFTFRWSGQKGKHAYAISIVDNKNAEVWRGTTGDAEITLEKRLEPGLYYAKLEADAKLADVGKFVVLRNPF